MARFVAVWLALAVVVARGRAHVVTARTEDPDVRTYLFSNVHSWEGVDHQVTSIVTLLALAKNISALAVLPALASGYAAGAAGREERDEGSLLGDYFDIERVRAVQAVMTMGEFRGGADYAVLKNAAGLEFPKGSAEEYEARLGVLGDVSSNEVAFGMPNVDPEATGQRCDAFEGTVWQTGEARFVFLERVHFFHFCAERFMPWWYDVRKFLVPRQEYGVVADSFMGSEKVTVVHIRDLLDAQGERGVEEIERYARQIVDVLRGRRGTLYLGFSNRGRSVKRVAELFEGEFENVKNCSHLYACGRSVDPALFNPRLSDANFRMLFETPVGSSMVEWALSMRSEFFVGNIHSPYSRNVGLYRKIHGHPYAVLKGFGEMRKLWKWNL